MHLKFDNTIEYGRHCEDGNHSVVALLVRALVACLTLHSTDTHFDASTLESFSKKHCGKRRNCSLRAISPFPTMFSTQSDNCIPICQYF